MPHRTDMNLAQRRRIHRPLRGKERAARLAALLLGGLLLLPALAAALESDSRQPIHVRADRAELDNRSGISTYRGNVTLDQGSLHLTADLLIVHRSANELERIEAEGQPVRFRQRPDQAEADIEGEARRLEYRAAENRLLLQGTASVRQGGDLFSGEHIEYDTVQSRVRASGQDSSTGQGDGRIHAIIQPRQPAANGESKP